MKIMNTNRSVFASFCLVIGLLALLASSGRALAQTEPVAPGYIEYSINTNHFTWFDTSDPIKIGGYVDDLLTDNRLGQPAGRGRLGIVTEIGFDPDYNQNAALVDFGNNYSAGIVFSELSSVTVVPEPSLLPLVVPALVIGRTLYGRRRRTVRQ